MRDDELVCEDRGPLSKDSTRFRSGLVSEIPFLNVLLKVNNEKIIELLDICSSKIFI